MKIKFFLTVALTTFFLVSNIRVMAQTIPSTTSQLNLQYDDGRLATEVNHAEIEGSPYLSDEWINGLVKFGDGRTYKDIPLKYNQANDVLYFQNDKKETLTFVKQVADFIITYSSDNEDHVKHFKSGFADISGYTTQNFFEVLVEGTAQLLKKNHKHIVSESGMALGTTTQKYADSESYYLVIADKAYTLKRDKKAILAILANKQAELEQFIKTNKLNLKEDRDLAKLIAYYNSI